MLLECFCCRGDLYTTLDVKGEKEENYICMSLTNGCGFSISLNKKQVTFCKIPLNESSELRYYNNYNRKEICFISTNGRIKIPFEKYNLKKIIHICKNKKDFFDKISKLIIFN
jgi:hypothetical protein